jgi:hypothetical protein
MGEDKGEVLTAVAINARPMNGRKEFSSWLC